MNAFKTTAYSLILATISLQIHAATHVISPSETAENELQEILILAEDGDVIELSEGIFDIKNGLSLDIDNITIKGAGMDKSILSFSNQTGGSEGLIITGDNTVLKDFAVENTKGDAIKSKGVDGIAFINIRTEWTNGPDENNGAYGLYPVSSKNVLIDGAVAIGASDAGIYVGQSENIIVRNSRAEYNVAGIEIENCYFADVYDNLATNNTGGILVFDLPDIPQQGGHHIRIFDNMSVNNNTDNFAPEGNIVGIVPASTGFIIMANSDVEIFNNQIGDNKTANLFIASYVEESEDENYYPHPRRLHIHHNDFGLGGYDPDDGEMGNIIRDAYGTTVPDIVWDGVMPLWRYFTVGLKEEDKHSTHDNNHVNPNQEGNAKLISYFALSWFYKASRSLDFDAKLEPLEPVAVTIRGQNVDEYSF